MREGKRPGNAHSQPLSTCRCNGMFVFFSNQFGCVGSILISLALTALLLFALHACGGPSTH